MPSLSVVLPAHNEEATVEHAVEEVAAVLQELGINYEIILVNDGSTDRTGETARTLAERIGGFRLVEHFPNRHYGGALKAGFAAATKDMIAFYPADKQFVFGDIGLLLTKLDEADIVSGYRADRRDNFVRRLNAFGWNSVVRLLFELRSILPPADRLLDALHIRSNCMVCEVALPVAGRRMQTLLSKELEADRG